MVSRKRGKGKERKAKKAEEEANEAELERCATVARALTWSRYLKGKDENDNKIIHCDHGCAVPAWDDSDSDHPIFSFMDSFMKMIEAYNGGIFSVLPGWGFRFRSTFLLRANPEIWNDNNNREMAIKILLSIGTNVLLLSKSTNISNSISCPLIANVITILEGYDEKITDMNDILCVRSVSSKVRDLDSCVTSQMRDLLKFYSKRITCSCLKEMYSEARKNMPKMGKCSYCNGVKERASLSICSRCRVIQYCSRGCQVAHWPTHQGYCNDCVKLHQKMTQR